MGKLTKEKLRAFKKEETESSKEYARLGLKSFAKDEAKHARFFGMLLKRK